MIELQGDLDKSQIILSDCKTPLSTTHRTSRQKFSKDIADLKKHIQTIATIGTLYPTRAENKLL